jgi:DNA processing protein
MHDAKQVEAMRSMVMLRVIPGLGDVGRRKLLARHRTPRAALRAALAERSPFECSRIAHEADLCLEATTRIGAAMVMYRSQTYPAGLRQLHAAPTLLWLRGDAALLDRPAVAIVGTRRNTEYGADTARALAADLARAGIVVISGLAHGIDRFAHEGALDAGGSTIAIIGTGIDVCYPGRHRQLQERIARDGLLISEFLPGERAMRHHFPRRNRLIAALSRGVVVVEAPERSGALNTADHAAELGRDVFAVPGPIGRETSMGTNALIRDGAGLVMDAGDILESLGLVPTDEFRKRGGGSGGRIEAALAVSSSGDWPESIGPTGDGVSEPGQEPSAADVVLALLDSEPRHVDEIAALCGLPVAVVTARLLCLEIEGQARQAPGLRFGLARHAA